MTGARRKKDVRSNELRENSKQKLSEGVHSTWEFLESTSFTIGSNKTPHNLALTVDY